MTRAASVRALAKINLDLRVLERRPDGYHEIRTVFQTISLADRLEIAFTPARRTSVAIEGPAIPDNLAERAAHAALAAMKSTAAVRLRLTKRIPMGAGLGGGSSDAAAVLLALPVLAGRPLAPATLLEIASELGSDVPFFLLGGAAAAIGRGTELFPLPDGPNLPGVLVTPEIHVSTAQAYLALGARLTSDSKQNKLVSFQSALWGGVCLDGRNDFEEAVFRQYPELVALKRRLEQSGARQALMSGSGSSVFGLFLTRAEASRALRTLGEERAVAISLVNRARYRRMWRRQLAAHLDDQAGDPLWPPLSRYAPTRPKR
jgi:4-diphosphocytidyl-2-C-methyl-D-erythritol kinase